MQTGHDILTKTYQTSPYLELLRQERRERRRRLLQAFAALLLLTLFTLCLRTTEPGLISPKDEILNLYTMARLSIADLFHLPLRFRRGELIAERTLYMETVGRFKSTILTVVTGAVVSLSGAIYQSIFRNPIAVPTMLGVTSGVNIGLMVLVLTNSTSALMMPGRGALYCYGFCFILLVVILLYGRFLGGKKFPVVEMLIAGSILTTILGEVITLVQKYMTPDDLVTLEQLLIYGFGLNGEGSVIWFALPLILALAVIFLIRFSMNAVCFTPEEAKTLGMDTFRLGILALLAGTMMIVVTTMYSGNVGMMALLIPFICRGIFGVDFRDQFVSCMLFGAGFLLICRIITVFCSFTHYTQLFTLTTVVSLLSTPVFLIVIGKGKRGWK